VLAADSVYYNVPFEDVPAELVAGRRVLLRKGWAYVPREQVGNPLKEKESPHIHALPRGSCEDCFTLDVMRCTLTDCSEIVAQQYSPSSFTVLLPFFPFLEPSSAHCEFSNRTVSQYHLSDVGIQAVRA
jgi:hypothetical protein